MSDAPIVIDGVTKRYGRTLALDEVSFEAPALAGQTVTIDAAYVRRMLADVVKNDDLSRYIL